MNLTKLKLRGRNAISKMKVREYGPWWWYAAGRGKEWIQNVKGKPMIYEYFAHDWKILKRIEPKDDE